MRIHHSVKSLFAKLRKYILPDRENISLIPYWSKRARMFGKHAVVNRSFPDDEFDNLTQDQKEILFPLLVKHLRGDEKVILDFGCGPGRFTSDLAQIIGGRSIGLDPISQFLDVAPAHTDVEYRQLEEERIPLGNDSVDVVWICLVLGGIRDNALAKTIAEIQRVLKPNGLLFIAENTTDQPDSKYWHYRSANKYRAILTDFSLVKVGEYQEINEEISILAGRKNT